MSTKIKGLVVSFDQNVSEEYAEKVKDAIRLMSHISGVENVDASIDDEIIALRLRHEFGEELSNLYDRIVRQKK